MNLRSVCAIWLALIGAYSAAAEIHFSLAIRREVMPAYAPGYGQIRYYAWPTLQTTTTPESYHRIAGPNDSCIANVGTSNSTVAVVFANASELFTALTNGEWTIWLNRDTPAEETYKFTLAWGDLATNALAAVKIYSPANGGINIASNSQFAWSGPQNFQALEVSVRQAATNILPVAATNWSSAPVLEPGTNFFTVSYRSNVTAISLTTIPTNEFQVELAGWAVTEISLETKAAAGFLSEGLPPTSLAQSLNATGMIWETFGAAEWFAQGTNATDGATAAQSGSIPDASLSVLRTVVYGSNTISFMWRSDCEAWADYIEFSDNGNYVTDLTGINAWENFTYQLADNVVHVLEWTFHKDNSDTEGADAAYLDQVRLGANAMASGPAVDFSFTVIGENLSHVDPLSTGQTEYRIWPRLASQQPPVSYHQVISPGGWFSAGSGPTNTFVNSVAYASIAELAPKLTNGLWTLWLNRETPQAQFYQFAIQSISPLSSNDLPALTIASPPDGQVGIASRVGFIWSDGWETPTETTVTLAQFNSETQTVYASESLLPPSIFAWSNSPLLELGTNLFLVRQDQLATNRFSVAPPYLGWSFSEPRFSTRASSGFVVSNANPARLLNGQITANAFQFQFDAPFGFTNVVQSRTNLTLGNWVDRTNLIGNGTLRTISLPLDNEPAQFFRIVTE